MLMDTAIAPASSGTNQNQQLHTPITPTSGPESQIHDVKPQTADGNGVAENGTDGHFQYEPSRKKQKRNKPTLSCEECVERKTKVGESALIRQMSTQATIPSSCSNILVLFFPFVCKPPSHTVM
jgi:hypothetical protein